MRVVCDIETDGLQPTKVWCIVCIDVDTDEVYEFIRPDLDPKPFIAFTQKVEQWIGHNFLAFDTRAINKLVQQWIINPYAVLDTLLVSRMLNYNRKGGHSLAAWGERLGHKKVEHDDWSQFSPDMLRRCIEDCRITVKLYKRWKDTLVTFEEAIRLEHDVTIVAERMHDNGFRFNYSQAKAHYKTLEQELAVLILEMQHDFPPLAVLVREINPKGTKSGTIHMGDFRWKEDKNLTGFSIGAPFSLVEWVEFNPGSTKQVVERLNACGWKPTDKTIGHIKCIRDHNLEKIDYYNVYGWTISEENLATLPEDAPRSTQKLVQWLLLEGRRSTLEEWLKAYNPATEAIHGTYLMVGAWTQRSAHRKPNMGNVPSMDSKYNSPILKALAKKWGTLLRKLWYAREGRVLVGTDAKGIQMRIFAHYVNDPELTQIILHGDIHTANQEALGPACKTRSDAKTFIYAWLLGAGVAKTAQILGCSQGEARKARERFIARYPGLQKLKDEQIPRDAARGYFVGFDGRWVLCDSEHLMLAGYLQCGESVVMKAALVEWTKEVYRRGILYWLVNYVHDEWQTETLPHMGEVVGHIQSQALRTVGERFKLNCPMDGNYKVGDTWYDTH